MQSRRAWPQLTLAQTLLGVALCLVVALMAQRSLDRHAAPSTPWALLAALGAAGTTFALLTHRVAVEASVDGAPTPASPISWRVLAATLTISLLGCLNFGDNRFRPPGVLLWSGGLLLTLIYLWLISAEPRAGGLLRTWREKGKVWVPTSALALLAIVLLGAWLRLDRLSDIPVELGFDLASKYFDSLAVANGEYSIFFPARLGREGLFFYSVALVGRFVGLTKATLHLTTALFGTLTILAVYFLGQEAFGRPAGLLAGFFLATNRWHIVLSRTGFRAATMPLFVALALHAFIRALRTRRPLDFGWVGVTVGIGIYSYRSFLFLPVALGVGLLLYLLAHGGKQSRSLLPGLVAAVFIAAAIIAPLARYALENPDEYLARERYQLEAQAKQEARSQGTLAHYVSSLLVFNYRGDADSRFNVPYVRQMGLASSVLLAFGLAHTLWRWRQGPNVILLATLAVLILPAALSMLPDEMPSALRLSGVIVPAVVLAAVPVVVIQQTTGGRERRTGVESSTETVFGLELKVHTGTRRRMWAWQGSWIGAVRWIVAVAAALMLAYETSEVRRYYFRDYVAHLPEMSNYSLPAAIAHEIKDYGDLQSVYIRAWPNWFDSSVLKLHLGTAQNWNPFVDNLTPDQPPLSTLERTALFIINVHDEASLAALRAFFPHGIAQVHSYPNGELAFRTFLAER